MVGGQWGPEGEHVECRLQKGRLPAGGLATFPSALLCSGWHQAQERTQGAQPNTCIFQKCSCNCVKSTIYLASGVTQLALVGAYLYRDAL